VEAIVFESAEIGHSVTRSRYRREEPKLRAALLEAQYRLIDKPDFPLLILVGGLDGAGKGETVNLLNEWMDPRHIRTEAFGLADGSDGGRAEMWRFWQVLPPRGKIGVFFGSWYTDPIVRRAEGRLKRARFERRLENIRHFERMLVAEGVLVLKLWFHLSKPAQKRRLRALGKNPLTAWRVTPGEWTRFGKYERYVKVAAEALRETSTGEAPWHVIDGSDERYRALTAGRLVLDALTRRLDGAAPVISPSAPPPEPSLDGRDLLNALDYTRKIPATRYDRELERAQGRVNLLTRHKQMRTRSLVLAFEGMDAAGKGSTIRRLTRALDARFYRVVPIGAPSDEERAQPYLWRFWRHLPADGKAVIYDRSWYGRVLVERVEGLCSEADWMRAYHEINEFEQELVQGGAIVMKFWLSITAQEQLRRFRAREKTPYKRHKITPEDWRNRKKWPQYEQAVSDMIERTSTDYAPWFLVPSNDKRYARVAVLNHVADELEKRLGA
jgi:polyphosphate:AMP phosphotransferase